MKNKIKKIFQIYHDKNKVNSYVKDNILKLNPDYEYILLDFEEGKEIINKNFNKIKAKKICDCLDKLVKYCHKSDLLRYCLLYIYGGVYLDVDLKPFVSFDKLYDNDDVDFVCCFGQGGGFAPYSMLPKNDKCYFPVMANGFIMSRKPLNELLLYLIDKIISSNNYLPKHTKHCENMFTKIKTICESDNRTKLKAYTTLKNNIYIYRETYVNKKFYIVNKNYDVVINSNKHNY